jgi:hypothetical protein
MLTQPRFVLAVPGLKVSVPFYRDKLGMDVEFEEGGWCFLSRDNFSLITTTEMVWPSATRFTASSLNSVV